MPHEKEIRWVGTSYADLLGFPADARREAGFQLGKVQAGLEPDNWKALPDIGAGAREIRIREPGGAFRVIYVATFEEAVFVLHCFQKKVEKMTRQDKVTAVARYSAASWPGR